MSIRDWDIAKTPLALVDLETSAFHPGQGRIVEIAIARLDAGATVPSVVFDTLVAPMGSVGSTDMHGIREEDVVGAPRFEDIAGDIVDALAGCAITAYNASFDMRFLQYEFGRLGVELDVPHFCTMRLLADLTGEKIAALDAGCMAHGVVRSGSHSAANDAYDAAILLATCRALARRRETTTFGELAPTEPLAHLPLAVGAFAHLSRTGLRKLRAVTGSVRPQLRAYTQALLLALADLCITGEELLSLQALRQTLRIDMEELQALHAQVFASAICVQIQDARISPEERQYLRILHGCLRQLGWAPGD